MFEKHSIGVRELVEFLLRSGDLGNGNTSPTAAIDGTNIHQNIQKSFDDNIKSEVDIQFNTTINNQNWIIHGRADGISYENEIPTEVIEIKTSQAKYKELNSNTLELYWAQAKLYGMFLMRQYNLKSIDISLIYVRVSTLKQTKKTILLSIDEAEQFYNEIISSFTEWVTLSDNLEKEKKESLINLKFPFDEYRKNQRELAVVAYKTIALNKRTFLEAPTGTGKTISTLFPALMAMSQDKTKRIFYLTAKQSTRHVAEQAINLMSDTSNLKIKSITLTAKEQITFSEEKELEDFNNPYLIGYYDRLRPALKDILMNESQITKDTIQKYARKYQIDPFEYSLDISLFCDVIICDYNYLFDPSVYLQRFFTNKDEGNCFLIDEAHNLVSRSRDMYTAELSSKFIDTFRQKLLTFTRVPQKLVDDLQKIKKLMNHKLNSTKSNIILVELDDNLIKALAKFDDDALRWLREHPKSPKKEFLQYFVEIHTFLKISDFYNETFRTEFYTKDDDFIFKIFCLDPSEFINKSLNLGGSAILFSATLSPVKYYQSLLGGINNSLAYSVSSPFDPNRQKILISSNLSMTYKFRYSNIPHIIDDIYALQWSHIGNYLVFLPSFDFLEQVVQAFNIKYPLVDIVIQKRIMSLEDRQEFINAFKEHPKSSLVGFVVLGGIFSEGIDFKGDLLSGVAITTVGLPSINPETDELKKYFDDIEKDGFTYAYLLPGMNKVLQSAGRVIRTSNDIGVVLLLDSRFSTPRYNQYFPSHWKNCSNFSSREQLYAQLVYFWDIFT